MKTRHSLKKSGNDFCQDGMDARAPSAGSSASSWPDSFCQLTSSMDVEGTSVAIDAGPTCYRDVRSSEDASQEEVNHRHERRRSVEMDPRSSSTCSTCISERDITNQLAHLLVDMMPGVEGAELGDAFQYAAELPPVTKQSLSELDIQNIITNIKLRHDVNFDRDLSFRPNLDGPKGQEKQRQSGRYWRALVAELELYARLFQGPPPLWNLKHVDWSMIVQHAERRIPKMFETIHEVLKSLVPDRDHARVEEHMDVPMLMQEIERGVCDLVKLAEWMATLLKEHCAPMRDVWVDEMVTLTRSGVATHSSDLIVCGLRKLLGILETMKLDVANHQIRNLKTLLIEDTVNFEKHYHLDRLVKGRSKVNIDVTQKWWAHAVAEFGQQQQNASEPGNKSRLHARIFIRAVVATLFSRDGHAEFPDTFYLDQDRLRVLKLEADDLIHLEICFGMFAHLVGELGYSAPVSHATRSQLQNSLSAIIGGGAGHGPQAWMFHSEPLSLEIYRQAHMLVGRHPIYNLEHLQEANQHLRNLFNTSVSTHASALEATIISQILSCSDKYHNSTPSELFNNLIVSPPPLQQHSLTSLIPQPTNTLPSLSVDRLTDLSNRITHITLLHWRIWAPIAYIQDDEASTPPRPSPPTSVPASPNSQATSEWLPPPPSHNVKPDTQVMDVLKTGEPPDPGEANLTR